jgi:hypothetical protein
MAFLRYHSGHTRGVLGGLLAYSPLGVTTIRHLLGGMPHIRLFFITMFNGLLGGVLLIAVAAWRRRTLSA